MGSGAISQDGSVDRMELDLPVERDLQRKPSPRPNDLQTGYKMEAKAQEAPREQPIPVEQPLEQRGKPAEGVPPAGAGAGAGAADGAAAAEVGASEAKREEPLPRTTSNTAVTVAAKSSGSGQRRRSFDSGSPSEGSVGSEQSDVEPVDVLLQFIPYYGQGDPSNDAIVRSTLSSLSVEDIDSQDEYGNTLLLLACQYRCEDLVRIMLNKGADGNALNSSGACCLHFACYRESASINVAKILLKAGANPDIAESTFGCTPLHYCAGTGDTEFCKLLLSYGAQIAAVDYYNYTCVDYAAEAGMAEVATYLQSRLEQDKGAGFASPGAKGTRSPTPSPTKNDASNWEAHADPESGSKYYIHGKTGECLWESELKQRLGSQKANDLRAFTAAGAGAGTGGVERASEGELVRRATAIRLDAFFAAHDSACLPEVSALLASFEGREAQLLQQMCEKYGVSGQAEMAAFQEELRSVREAEVEEASRAMAVGRGLVLAPGQFVSDAALIDPLLLQELSREERKRFEERLAEETAALRKKYEGEVGGFIQAISLKEGQIAKLTSEVESLGRGRSGAEEDMAAVRMQMATLTLAGGEQVTRVQSELEAAQTLCRELKAQLALQSQELNYERERLTSLDGTMANLATGNEEIVAREKAAAQERATNQREREEQHAEQVRALEEVGKQSELRLKQEMSNTKAEVARREGEAEAHLEGIKRSKEAEIDNLGRDLAEIKSQAAQELSSANLQLQDLQRTVGDALAKATQADQFVREVQGELAEAKMTQKFNAQLHKDLQREQLMRKKLHNDIEDLKGKIRVYVRVRPFSKSELAKYCSESVIRDSKMGVMVKGLGAPDAKKYYDFDQVFGGGEGNTQEDVFRDTKHLMTSVVDGYNVCIFAYGQTGAGKSFTMIGAAGLANCMSENGDFDELAGITPRAVSELFRLLNERSAQVEFKVEVQMFQIYRDALEDLLAAKGKKEKSEDEDKKKPSLKITLAEHSPTGLVMVEGAVSMDAQSPAEVMRIFAKGASRRTTASTQMNEESSRSHLVCCLVAKLANKRTGRESIGKLTLVDLAGSERVDKSGAMGDVLKEAQSINKSLSALGDVIAALTTGAQHVPYRNHQLTMLMSDSIGGNAKTLMFVNTSPADYNTAESNNALAFASRCKDVANTGGAQGAGVQAAQFNALKKELAKLKKGGGGGGGGGPRTLGRGPGGAP